jgi:hypothetical protein
VTAGFRAIRWAKSVPEIRSGDGRVDRVAHHVLLVLATFADAAGHARPSVSTLAQETYIAQRTVTAVLGRLEAAGLITRAGLLTGGTQIWALALSVTRDEDPAAHLQQKQARDRALAAARSRRYRERIKATACDHDHHAVGQRDVTPPESVTSAPHHGAGHHDVTLSGSVSDAAVTVTTAAHTGYNCQ